MSYASEANRLIALENFVRRLYVADCLQSSDPVKRLEEHKAFAEEWIRNLLEETYKTTDSDLARENNEIAISISALYGPIGEEVRSSIKREDAQ